MNFEEVFRKMLIVINGIYDFRFDINFALLLQFLYIISPKKVSPKAVIDFFSRIFVYRSLYGQSFFTYISNMIDDFQDLLLHFSNLIFIFKNCVISVMTVYYKKNGTLRISYGWITLKSTYIQNFQLIL